MKNGEVENSKKKSTDIGIIRTRNSPVRDQRFSMLARVRKEYHNTVIISYGECSDRYLSLEVLLEQGGDLIVDLDIGIHRPGEVQMREAGLLIHEHDVSAGLDLYVHERTIFKRRTAGYEMRWHDAVPASSLCRSVGSAR